MDDITQRLRDDASRIDASVSPELEDRIRASLENVASTPAPRPRRPTLSLWWASSLTGVVAAAIVIVAVRLVSTPEQEPPQVAAIEPLALPILKTETAVLTAPLEQELVHLEADLRKAELAVRKEIGLTP